MGRDIRDVLTVESVPKVEAALAALRDGEATGGRMELNHFDGAGREYAMRYTLHRFGEAGTYLMIGHDLGAIAEMQQQLVNAQVALERDYERRRETDTRFRVLLESCGAPALFVSLANGQITEANADAADFLGASGSDLSGSHLGSFATAPDGSPAMAELVAAASEDRPAALKVRASEDIEIVQAKSVVFRAASERVLFCRFEIAEAAAQTAHQNALNQLFVSGPDAIVFTAAEGRILSTNDAFLRMAEAPDSAAVRGEMIDGFLARGRIDFGVLSKHAGEQGSMRLYATQLNTGFGGRIPVEISVTELTEDDAALVFVIRDATRNDNGRSLDGNDENARNVMALVGTSTLKEIVAETTDVIERMCIETAVELTGNNRVAAAEMLGLSRQSFYVRLRKYGLLSREAAE